jgi:hypothetical protein
MAEPSYGFDNFSDRAQSILWKHTSCNSLPRHVRTLDSGTFHDPGKRRSAGRNTGFFLLTEFVHRSGCFKDLELIRGRAWRGRRLRQGSVAYRIPGSDPQPQARPSPPLCRPDPGSPRHGECIMGTIENYPPAFDFIVQALLRRIDDQASPELNAAYILDKISVLLSV